ncbi:hypothetical protein L9G74_05060 [Shewanella sp. C32]|uniref:Uncharacterized protein n=1 Tax=Shewanella electrica TaxID=515560 RepID=A0ABT2FHJ4_9GAMM|nr:hypothetical protein [Shewanella electrica]MCH1923896.1 hypothetical protein [Shewanella electrica]MCS4555800.1 hypothetical protein [Shewanella electrica]
MQSKTVTETDKLIRNKLWCDFEVASFTGSDVVIRGGIDLCYSWELVLTFNQVAGYFGAFAWQSDTSAVVFDMPVGDELLALNLRYDVEMGYQIYRFTPEYHSQPIIIIAQGMSCKRVG